MAPLFFLCILNLFICFSVQENAYLVTAPKLFRLDASETVVVQLFGYDQETTVDISLMSTLGKGSITYDSSYLTLNSNNKFHASTTLRILSKDFPKDGKSVYLRAASSAFTAFTEIPVTTVSGFLFIQTDKPLYTPEQEVQVRVYSLNEELGKSGRAVTLTFVDPRGVTVEIINMRDIYGANTLLPPFKIPLKPIYGIWTIVATYEDTFDTSASAHFEVKEYVMPSISLNIKPESSYISEDKMESFKLTILAKYVNGRPVSSADIFLTFGYSVSEETVMIPSTYRVYELESGRADIILNIKSALASMPDGPQYLRNMKENTFLRVTVLLQETTGGLSQQAELTNVKFVESPFTLSLIATPPFIKPGIPYSMRVLVKNPLGEPEKGVAVKVTGKLRSNEDQWNDVKFSGYQESVTVTSGKDGIAYFTCNIPGNTKEAEFIFETDDPTMAQAPLVLKAESYVSVNNRYLYIDLPAESSSFKVGDYIDVNIVFEYREFLNLKTFSYLIMSKGKIIQHNTVNRVSEKVQSINIKITADMVPSARLIVYYVLYGEEKSELVADSTWIDVRAKCVNNLDMTIAALNSQNGYKPKDELILRMSSKVKAESLVALSAIDTALYNLRSNEKDPLKRILQHVEKSDLGCGIGGGKNNADVFDRAGLTFITNANAEISKKGGTCSDRVRPKRSIELKEKIEQKANKYGPSKNCCLAGTRSSPILETCEDRAKRLPLSGNMPQNKKNMCRRAFLECCEFVLELRKNNIDKIILSRAAIDFLIDEQSTELRSYFPESWLWEETTMQDGSVTIRKTLPDSLTTWELKAVGVFSNGICVSDEKIQVMQDISVDVPVPYSMVRGEQIELRGSVYNQQFSGTQFSVFLRASKGLCVFRGSNQGADGKPNENKGYVDGHSVAMVSFYVMALEAGTHTLVFNLTTERKRESVVKKLRVVPEGIKKEENEGKRIDPRGVFGTIMRKQEFKNEIPAKIVPKSSVDRVLTINGEVLGEILSILNNPEGLKQLTNLPRGSAEQELMALLPVFYVYHYLEKSGKWNILDNEWKATEKELKRKMTAGIRSIMSFQLKNGEAFSMWAKKDRTANTWVTALIIKSLTDMRDYISLDTDMLANAIHWLIRDCQNEDGSFSEKSTTSPLKLMGAGAGVAEKSVFLTSFVVIAIKNAMNVQKLELQIFKNSLDKAVRYLITMFENPSNTIKSLYVRAIASYSLSLVDKDDGTASILFENIKKEAQIEGNPARIRFWEDSKSVKDPLKPSAPTAKTVETTVYVLLNCLDRGEISYAKPILNWLTQDQRYGGGVYSTQDSILTLEAITKYSIVASKANLDMPIRIDYKTQGYIGEVQLTQKMPVSKPIEVTKNDIIIVKTAMSSGVSFVKLKSVYYEMAENNENCLFDMSIEIQDRDANSDDPMLLSPRIVACAKFNPPENSLETDSTLTVMEINLPTGVIPIQEDLEMNQNGLEATVSNYEIVGNQVILQIESIPSNEFSCVGFRIQEEFKTGMTQASVFKVYEFQAPDLKCTKLYNKQSRKLLRLCEGDQCQCMAAECCNFRSTIDPSLTVEQRKPILCKESVKYAFKVQIDSFEVEGDFMTYKAKVQLVLKKEETDDLKTDSEVEFVKKATCSSTEFKVGQQYLIITADSLKIKLNNVYKYKFPLDSQAWVDWWPLDCTDDSCRQYIKVLNDLEFDVMFNGCV